MAAAREIIIPGKVFYGKFNDRPNRFLVNLYPEDSRKLEKAFLHDPGRMKELLLPAAKLLIRKPLASSNPQRKTKWDILAVEHHNQIIIINSQIPNIVAEHALKKHWIPELRDFQLVRSEITFGQSRLDFFLQNEAGDCYLEVKGVTLVDNEVALFPDAPTTRGTRHLNELMRIQQKGAKAVVLFLVMREDPKFFTANEKTDPTFSQTLLQAYKSGVEILIYNLKPFLRDKQLRLRFGNKLPLKW